MLELNLAWAARQIGLDLRDPDRLDSSARQIANAAECVLRAAAVAHEALPGVDELVFKALELESGVWGRELAERIRWVRSFLATHTGSPSSEEREQFLLRWQEINRQRQQLEAVMQSHPLGANLPVIGQPVDDFDLKVTDVSKITGLSTAEVSRACESGKLAFNGKSGHDRRISRTSVIDHQMSLAQRGLVKVIQKRRE